jgi:hypothetical protein
MVSSFTRVLVVKGLKCLKNSFAWFSNFISSLFWHWSYLFWIRTLSCGGQDKKTDAFLKRTIYRVTKNEKLSSLMLNYNTCRSLYSRCQNKHMFIEKALFRKQNFELVLFLQFLQFYILRTQIYFIFCFNFIHRFYIAMSIQIHCFKGQILDIYVFNLVLQL